MGWEAFWQAFQTVALGVAALVGAYVAWRGVPPARSQARAAARQAELAKRAHVLDLFNRAMTQLADEKREIRLGAIYTLSYVMDDFPDLSGPVVGFLTTYLRECVPPYEGDPPMEVREIARIVQSKV